MSTANNSNTPVVPEPVVYAAEFNDNTGWLPWRWLPQVISLLLISVELCWVIPWYHILLQFSNMASVGRSVFVLGGIMLAAYVVAAVMDHLRLLRNVQLFVLGLLLAVSVFLAERLLLEFEASQVVGVLLDLNLGAVLVLFFVLWLWWRGLTLAREPVHPSRVWRRFGQGLLLYMGYILVAARMEGFILGLGWFVFFLFLGFMTVILARISYIGISTRSWESPFGRRWFAGTSVIVGATIIAAAVLGSLLTGQYILVLEWLGEAVRLLVTIGLMILAIPSILLSFILEPLLGWLQGLLASSPPLDPLVTEEQIRVYETPTLDIETVPIDYAWLQSLIFWGVIILLVIFLLMRLRSTISVRKRTPTYGPESLLKRGDASSFMRQALRDAVDDLAARVRPGQRVRVADRIRQIYVQLLDLCEELDRPRPSSKTPLEFLPEMGKLFTRQGSELKRITQAYQRVRYGELPETQAEVDQIEAAWQRIFEEGKRLKRTGEYKTNNS
jgi:hypothetical protein